MKMQTMTLAFLCTTLGATDAVAQSNNFDGLYKPRGAEFSNWDCKTVGEDGGAFSISDNKLTLTEEACALSNPIRIDGTMAVFFDAQCAIEGTEYETKLSLEKSEFGIVFSGEGFAAEWESCESPSVNIASGTIEEQQAQEQISAVTPTTDDTDITLDANIDAFDGIYIVELGRVWRDIYWSGRGDEYYVLGRFDPLSRAMVQAEGGQIELLEAIEFKESGGPVFETFFGRISEDGILNFRADVNYLVGKPAPFDLRVSIDLSGGMADGATLDAEPEGFDAAYDARVRVMKLSTDVSPAGRVQPREAERLAEQQIESARLAAEQVEREPLAAEQEEREWLAAERAEQERLAAERDLKARAKVARAWLADEREKRELIAAEQAERERSEAEEVERARLAAEQAEADISQPAAGVNIGTFNARSREAWSGEYRAVIQCYFSDSLQSPWLITNFAPCFNNSLLSVKRGNVLTNYERYQFTSGMGGIEIGSNQEIQVPLPNDYAVAARNSGDHGWVLRLRVFEDVGLGISNDELVCEEWAKNYGEQVDCMSKITVKTEPDQIATEQATVSQNSRNEVIELKGFTIPRASVQHILEQSRDCAVAMTFAKIVPSAEFQKILAGMGEEAMISIIDSNLNGVGGYEFPRDTDVLNSIIQLTKRLYIESDSEAEIFSQVIGLSCKYGIDEADKLFFSKF